MTTKEQLEEMFDDVAQGIIESTDIKRWKQVTIMETYGGDLSIETIEGSFSEDGLQKIVHHPERLLVKNNPSRAETLYDRISSITNLADIPAAYDEFETGEF